AHVRSDELAFDAGVLARFGIDAALAGRLAITADVGAGALATTFTADVHDLHGGALVKPIELHAQGTTEARGTQVAATAHAGQIILGEVTARSPLTVATWRAWRTAPVEGTVGLPSVPARTLLATVGRTNVTDGVLTGTI